MRIPLINPIKAERLDGRSPWFLGLHNPLWIKLPKSQEQEVAAYYGYSHVEELEKFAVKDGVILAYSAYVDPQANPYVRNNFYHWFVMIPDKDITKGFHTEEEFLEYIQALGVEDPDWQTPNEAYKQFRKTGCLDWIPDCGIVVTLSQEIYKNSERGITLVKPDPWDFQYFERNGEIVLEAKVGFLKKESTRIEIVAPPCGHNPTSQNLLSEELVLNIERMRNLYNLASINVLEGPTAVQTGDYSVSKAVIEIPTMSMPQDSSRIQVGERSAEKMQIIDLVAINDQNKPIMVYVYKGNNERLNFQAQEIISSIRRTCLPEQK